MKHLLPVTEPAAGGAILDLPNQLRLTLGVVAYAVVGAITLSPLLWASVPPLIDYPNHLARMWILVHRAEIPEIASNYLIHWRLVPNLAMDLVVPSLAKIAPVETAGRLFIGLTMLGLFGGTIALHRVLQGRTGLWPLCSALFIYNCALYWGFLNFLFGAGLFLFAFSGWIATKQWRIVPRIAIFSAVAAALMIVHLFAFGLYGLAVAAYELGLRIDRRRLSLGDIAALGVIGMQFVPALLLWAASVPNSGPRYTSYGGLAAIANAIRAPATFGNGMLPVDLLLNITYGAFLIFAVNRRWLKLIPEMKAPVIAFFIVAMLMPEWLYGSWGANIRIPVILPFIVIAGTRLETPQRRQVAAFAVAGLVLLGARVWTVSETWAAVDHDFAEFRAAVRVMSPGARLLVVERALPEQREPVPWTRLGAIMRRPEVYWHMPNLAIIERSAFTPNLFTGWTPVVPAPRNAGLFRTQAEPLTPETLVSSADRHPSAEEMMPNPLGEVPYWYDWQKNFDFVLWINPDGNSVEQLKELEPAARGSFFRIYRVVRPGGSAAPAAVLPKPSSD